MHTRSDYVFLTAEQIENLRALPDYCESFTAKGYIILGREKDTRPYRRSDRYIGRVLNPERRGEQWTFEKNAAFWLGAIESNKDFLIVTDLDKIAERAKFGRARVELGVGGCVPELLWLEDNGYVFAPDSESRSLSYAISPLTVQRVNFTLDYNHGKDLCMESKRVVDIADDVHIQRKKQHRTEKFHHTTRRYSPLNDITNQSSTLFAKKNKRANRDNDFDGDNENRANMQI